MRSGDIHGSAGVKIGDGCDGEIGTVPAPRTNVVARDAGEERLGNGIRRGVGAHRAEGRDAISENCDAITLTGRILQAPWPGCL